MRTDTYIIARNRKGRPTLMHKRDRGSFGYTACGIKMEGWSRSYMGWPIKGLLCKKCEKVN